MAAGRYEVYLSSDRGVRLAFLTAWSQLEYVKVVHNVGAVVLTLPAAALDMSMVREDNKVEVWRAYPGGPMTLEQVGLIAGWKEYADQAGTEFVQLICVDGNDIVRRANVKGDKGSTVARKTGYPDNIAKQLVREHLTAASSYEARIPVDYFTVEADTSLGCAPFTKDYAWRNLMSAVTAACETSFGRDQTKAIYWYVVPVSATRFEFRTYLGQVGQNRTYPGGTNPLIFSLAHNNMKEPAREWNAVDEVNHVTAVGGDDELPNDWAAGDAWDPERRGMSVYSDRRAIIQAGATDNGDELVSAAIENLLQNRPKSTFSFALADNEACLYGRDWGFGDRVTAQYRGQTHQARIKSVTVTVPNNGPETIIVGLEVIPPRLLDIMNTRSG